MRIKKTKLYTVTYRQTGGSDVFSGEYIISHDWLMTMIKNGTAKVTERQ